MKREIGFYWCKVDRDWQISYWTGNEWHLFHGYVAFYDNHFIEIDENRITRNPGLKEAVDFAKKGIEAVTILFNNLKSKQREKVYFPGDLRAKGDKLFGLL